MLAWTPTNIGEAPSGQGQVGTVEVRAHPLIGPIRYILRNGWICT